MTAARSTAAPGAGIDITYGTITNMRVVDVRFPTSRQLDGSDAMNPDPDYSAAYVILETDRGDGLTGHGLSFTIGRGTEIVCAAVGALRPMVVGQAIATFADAPGAFWKLLTGDSQLRWLGPEKGVMHLATAAVVNALWDLYAKIAGKPLWKLLSDMSPAQIVELVDWRYLTDALTPEEARRALDQLVPTRDAREAELRETGYPAYTTSAGWLGYTDEKIRRLCREGLAAGFTRFKIKVGLDRADDLRRATLVRQEIGADGVLMIDANQRWDVGVAIDWVRSLAATRPLWIEEPTSPDDVLGHAAIARALEPLGIAVATGEHCANRVMFKQMLQARALAFCQIDFCRLAGVNEVIAVQLLAAHFGVPVCPHAGGVGLCEYVQHASFFDYIAVSGSLAGRCIEYVDHLHEHFVDPCVIAGGRYRIPLAPGSAIAIKAESMAAHTFPTGRSGERWPEMSRNGWFRRARAVALGGLFAVAAATSVSCPRRQLNAVAVVPKGTTHEFWKSVHAGANRAGEELRVQILWKGPLREDDREQQIQAVETFANMNVLGIALAPLDSKALVPAARDVASRHIPLVIFDSDLASDDRLSFVATDNFHGGQLAGQYLGQLLAGQASARVAMLRYQEGSDSTNQREQGFLEAIAAFPNVKVVSSNQYGGATTESAFKASENLLAAQTTAAGATLQGIFCPNESTAFGMLRALEDHRLAGKVRFIGFDTSDKLVEALRQGHMDATVVQDPMRMGYLAVKTIIDHLRGGVVKKRVDTGATLVRREEIDDPKMKALLFPDFKRWLKE